jgi:hypothetical protein
MLEDCEMESVEIQMKLKDENSLDQEVDYSSVTAILV